MMATRRKAITGASASSALSGRGQGDAHAFSGWLEAVAIQERIRICSIIEDAYRKALTTEDCMI
jgi:hypothetical protein